MYVCIYIYIYTASRGRRTLMACFVAYLLCVASFVSCCCRRRRRCCDCTELYCLLTLEYVCCPSGGSAAAPGTTWPGPTWPGPTTPRPGPRGPGRHAPGATWPGPGGGGAEKSCRRAGDGDVDV